jgi:hypothetical protein
MTNLKNAAWSVTKSKGKRQKAKGKSKTKDQTGNRQLAIGNVIMSRVFQTLNH